LSPYSTDFNVLIYEKKKINFLKILDREEFLKVVISNIRDAFGANYFTS